MSNSPSRPLMVPAMVPLETSSAFEPLPPLSMSLAARVRCKGAGGKKGCFRLGAAGAELTFEASLVVKTLNGVVYT